MQLSFVEKEKTEPRGLRLRQCMCSVVMCKKTKGGILKEAGYASPVLTAVQIDVITER